MSQLPSVLPVLLGPTEWRIPKPSEAPFDLAPVRFWIRVVLAGLIRKLHIPKIAHAF